MAIQVTDISAALAAAASLAGVGLALRRGGGRRVERAFVVGLVLLGAWVLALGLVVRSPDSAVAAAGLLGTQGALAAVWWYLAARLATGGPAGSLGPWTTVVATGTALSIGAAVAGAVAGVDWITGIGPEPAVVLSRAGRAAVAVSAGAAACGLAVLGRVLAGGSVGLPVLLVGVLGAMASALWVSAEMLWGGYFLVGSLVPPAVVAALAAVCWAAGLVWPAAPRRPVASRRFVFAAVVVAALAGYLLAAGSLVGLMAEIGAGLAPGLAVMTAALAAAALLLGVGSQRVRHRLWGAVGRYVFRSKHDYGEVWVRLTELILRSRAGADWLARTAEFCRDLVYVSGASVWLVNRAGELVRVATTCDDGGPGVLAAETVAGLADGDVFARLAGSGVAVPLRLDGQLLGFLAIGRPEEAGRLDEEDRRVLGYVAAQVASAVALQRSGEDVAEAREVASFHRLSAFVIHDLKNLVAQQSFVLQNAARYRDDPAFVADALAAFEDSTNRMRALVARLRARDTGVGVATGGAAWDLLGLLDELVAAPRIARRDGCRARVVPPADGGPCPVRVDREAMATVFGNLLLNAVESLPPAGGEIVVRVVRDAGAWRVTVADTGCGIPEGFLRAQLFRPFQTTKPGGLGIGLYQCRALVEAAGGSIAVRSQAGAGTEVTVRLPAADPAALPAGASGDGDGPAASAHR